jgi:hypothetical protein
MLDFIASAAAAITLIGTLKLYSVTDKKNISPGLIILRSVLKVST